MSEAYHYVITTFCSAARQPVRITLENTKLIKGNIVNGKPVDCTLARTCQHKDSPLCSLKSIRIEARGQLIR